MTTPILGLKNDYGSLDTLPAADVVRHAGVLEWLAAGYLGINLTGGASSDTLTQAQYEESWLNFTGTLTANTTRILPTHAGRRWLVTNNTTGGSYTLTVKTAAGAGVAISRGRSALVGCDGTDILAFPTDLAGLTTVQSFTADFTLAPGKQADVLVDFSAVGSFATDYWFRADPDQAGVLVFPRADGRTAGQFRLLVINGAAAPAGTYGTASQIRLTCRLEGFGFTSLGGAATATPAVLAYQRGRDQRTITANTTVAEDDEILWCDTSGGGFIVTLPDAATWAGRSLVVKHLAGTVALTVHPVNSQTIDGAAGDVVLNTAFAHINLTSDGANWLYTYA